MDPNFSQRQALRRQAAATIATSLSVMASSRPPYELSLCRIASRVLLSDCTSISTRASASILRAVIATGGGEVIEDDNARAEAANLVMQLSHEISADHFEAFDDMCKAFSILWRRSGRALLPLVDQAAEAARSRLGGS